MPLMLPAIFLNDIIHFLYTFKTGKNQRYNFINPLT
jgi:hypothetical protein